MQPLGLLFAYYPHHLIFLARIQVHLHFSSRRQGIRLLRHSRLLPGIEYVEKMGPGTSSCEHALKFSVILKFRWNEYRLAHFRFIK
jgi:hypothetical protein